MTKHEMEMDAYREEMFERRANGIEEITFREWRFQKATMRAFIESLSYARHIEREIDLARGK